MPPRKRTSCRVADVDMPRRAFTPLEVAAQLGLPYEFILNMIKDGILGHIPAGRYKLVPVDELDRFLSQVKHGDVA